MALVEFEWDSTICSVSAVDPPDPQSQAVWVEAFLHFTPFKWASRRAFQRLCQAWRFIFPDRLSKKTKVSTGFI